MMALVHDDVAIVRDEIFDISFALQTLDHGNINQASSLDLSASNVTDVSNWKSQEGCQSLTPLVHKLAPVHQDQCIDRPPGDQTCTDDRLSECGRSTEHALVVKEHLIDGFLLFRPQLKCSFTTKACSVLRPHSE